MTDEGVKEAAGIGERALKTPDMEWRDLPQFPGNVKAKVLREEPDGGAKTMIVRLAVGSQIVRHSHTGAVQHYVLEREYESEGRVYRAGAYRFLPAHADLAPITTTGGVVILMVYDPICPSAGLGQSAAAAGLQDVR